MTALLLLAGVAGLVAGGLLIVRSAVSVAARLGVSPAVAGTVVAGFALSAPELAAALTASLGGAPGLAAGTIVGSAIATVLLVLGTTALVAPVVAERRAVVRDGGVAVAGALLFAVAAFAGVVSRQAGIALLGVLVAYLVFTLRADARRPPPSRLPASGASIVPGAAGLLLVVGGAQALVGGVTGLAGVLAMPVEVAGLTAFALATALPELAVATIAARRGEAGVALGAVLGSAVFNTVWVGGVTALAAPLPIAERMRAFDVPVMVAVSIVAVAMMAISGRLTRFEGLALVTLYAGYVAFVTGLV